MKRKPSTKIQKYIVPGSGILMFGWSFMAYIVKMRLLISFTTTREVSTEIMNFTDFG